MTGSFSSCVLPEVQNRLRHRDVGEGTNLHAPKRCSRCTVLSYKHSGPDWLSAEYPDTADRQTWRRS